MVPMRLDAYDTCPSAEVSNVRPLLVLKDMTAEPRRSTRVRRSAWNRLENSLIAAALVLVVVFFVCNFALSLVHLVQQSYANPSLPTVVTISQTVARGDTLAKLAVRYGNPTTYILEREDQIARANHLAGITPLVPGQRLQIPVTNPTLIAQIAQNSHHTRLASR